MVGCTVQELGARMTSEEFAWWCVMIEQDLIGPAQQSRLLVGVVAGVRNGPLQGPQGEKSLWSSNDFLPQDRWEPPKPKPTARELKAAVRGWFRKVSGKKR